MVYKKGDLRALWWVLVKALMKACTWVWEKVSTSVYMLVGGVKGKKWGSQEED